MASASRLVTKPVLSLRTSPPVSEPDVTTGTNPLAIGAWAMSQPAWDPAHHSIWYTDGNAGFFDVRLTHGVGKLLD